jgi:hypothetical protein
MSDNLRRYRALRDACAPWYPGQPSSTVARYLRTLAALISGIVGSTSTPLLHIAAQVPNGTTPESRVVGAQLFAVVRLTIDLFSWAAVPCMAVHGVRQRVEPQPDGTYGVGGPSRIAGFSEERGGRDARRAPYYLG